MQSFEFINPFIKLPLDGHSILVNTDTDEVFMDGDRVNLDAGKTYEEVSCKPGNTKNWQKRRLKTTITNNHIIVIDIGWDGRLFFLYFTKAAYNTFRGKPKKQYSYWNDGKRKAFYEDDLSNAVWVKSQAQGYTSDAVAEAVA